MLQAMNTGHDGSMTTVHSNSPRDTLRRIETMVLMAGTELPLKAIREQVSSAIDLIIHMERVHDGSRKVVQVSEVQGMEGDSIIMQDIFVFEAAGIQNGRLMGSLKATGLRPKFFEKFAMHGVEVSPDLLASS
jgi:pilus assembly protein CpaF